MSHTVAPNSLPVFDGTNYTLWKIRMRAYFKSINVWHIVESGWTRPEKAIAEWTTEEKNNATANDKAINAIYISVSNEEFSRISRCEIAKEAWETLEITHEGTKVVRTSKIQMLVSQFEEIRMQEDETFDEFYSKLSAIRNSTINLGKKMDDAKVVKKILRSLPERFIPQIAAIQQSKDLDTMRVEELVGSLQTFELILPKHKNTKNIALKAKNVKVDSCGSSDEDSGNEEEIAMFAKKFRKFFRAKKGNFRNSNSQFSEKSRNENVEKGKSPKGIKCHECGGHGHIRVDCANLRKSNGKAFNVTQSDESDKDDAEQGVNYLAFGVSYESEHENSECNSQDKQGVSDNDSEEEDDLQNAYNNLFVEYTKLKKLNKQQLKKLNEVNLENDQLSVTLTDSLATHNTLMSENQMLIAKVKSLENELNESKNHLTKFSSEKLNQMLHNQKHSFDRTGLGFDKSAILSTNVASSSKMIFVKPVNKEDSLAEKKVISPQISKGGKGKGTLTDSYMSSSKSRSMHMLRNQPSQRFIPTCHNCGKIGHIRPKCFQLNSHEPKREYFHSRNSYEKLFNMMRDVVTRLDVLDKSHTVVPDVKKVWVKKINTIHPLRGSGSDLTLI